MHGCCPAGVRCNSALAAVKVGGSLPSVTGDISAAAAVISGSCSGGLADTSSFRAAFLLDFAALTKIMGAAAAGDAGAEGAASGLCIATAGLSAIASTAVDADSTSASATRLPRPRVARARVRGGDGRTARGSAVVARERVERVARPTAGAGVAATAAAAEGVASPAAALSQRLDRVGGACHRRHRTSEESNYW